MFRIKNETNQSGQLQLLLQLLPPKDFQEEPLPELSLGRLRELACWVREVTTLPRMHEKEKTFKLKESRMIYQWKLPNLSRRKLFNLLVTVRLLSELLLWVELLRMEVRQVKEAGLLSTPWVEQPLLLKERKQPWMEWRAKLPRVFVLTFLN
jgi:hypothetical protein